jgi:arsenate reductase
MLKNAPERGNKMLFLHYPKCSTCQKAKKWLDEHQIAYTARHIADEHPSYGELKEWHEKSGLPLKKFFNTSGLVYKEMKLKDRLPAMREEEQLKLLAENGMLVKRPVLAADDKVLVGFREAEWADRLL